jgi:hypothetical protein
MKDGGRHTEETEITELILLPKPEVEAIWYNKEVSTKSSPNTQPKHVYPQYSKPAMYI